MTPFDIKAALDGMVVLFDTREQDTPRLRARLKQIGCKHERIKLDYGDYSAKFPLPNGEWFSLEKIVTVERKMDFSELASCYCTGRKRFTSEFERAKNEGAKVYLLVEGESWEKAYNGSYRSRMAPQSMIASMLAWLARYDCQLLMCKPETSGQLIRDVLYREGKERLERGEADCLKTAT